MTLSEENVFVSSTINKQEQFHLLDNTGRYDKQDLQGKLIIDISKGILI